MYVHPLQMVEGFSLFVEFIGEGNLSFPSFDHPSHINYCLMKTITAPTQKLHIKKETVTNLSTAGASLLFVTEDILTSTPLCTSRAV